MNDPLIQKALDEFMPRVLIEVTKLNISEEEYKNIFDILVKSLRGSYEFVWDYNKIQIGKSI